MHDAHEFLSEWMRRLEMDVSIDAVGNLRGYYPASTHAAPRFVIGSHIDTVPDAGAFDGVLGVVLGLTLVEALNGLHLSYGIEVIAFSEEEGVRFGAPFIGSLACIGELPEEFLQRRDKADITLEQAIRDFGLDPALLSNANLSPDAFAFVEFHIEQGPVLDELNLPLGIVEAIAGQSRLEVVFKGRANHAGTTPMNVRRDAMAGASEWILAVEREARATPAMVATVGRIAAYPGVDNVIAGEVTLSLDIRHPDDTTRNSAVASLIDRAGRIAHERGLAVNISKQLHQAAVKMDENLADRLAAAAASLGLDPHRIVSGAGHDAMVMARKLPVAMLFLRSPGGISHHPDESVRLEDVAAAIKVGHRFLLDLQVI
jgi:allantoate deiminase